MLWQSQPRNNVPGLACTHRSNRSYQGSTPLPSNYLWNSFRGQVIETPVPSQGGKWFYFMGLGQGSRGAPPSWICLSSVIVNIIRKLKDGAHIVDPMTGTLIHSVGAIFVDDSDLYCRIESMPSAEELYGAIHCKMPKTRKVFLVRARLCVFWGWVGTQGTSWLEIDNSSRWWKPEANIQFESLWEQKSLGCGRLHIWR